MVWFKETQVQLSVIYKYAVKLGAKHVEIAGILPNFCCGFFPSAKVKSNGPFKSFSTDKFRSIFSPEMQVELPKYASPQIFTLYFPALNQPLDYSFALAFHAKMYNKIYLRWVY